ncbi:ABC transporter [Sphaerisporangium rufum]|uniref:ABC transporter n=1 Tax=Sphaerisporangium rufum TaxID=1381558 RepID=A0A919V8G4_9ACTN|nr:ABC transporter [Sphaerisporangium rufum]
MPGEPGETVRLTSLRRTYGDGPHAVAALAGVTAGFAAGTFTAVMGPSGSGKSTLLHCAAGLDRPTGGTVAIEGTDLGALDETALTVFRRERVGFVFQEYNLVSALTAEQNVSLPLRLSGRAADPDRVRSALADVGLAGREGHRPGGLSGGERQRVAIARALVTGPAVVFADEPTGALDTRASHGVLRLLRGLVDSGQTVIMVTHDPVAAAHADRVLFLADGAVAGDLAGPVGAETVACRLAGMAGMEVPA